MCMCFFTLVVLLSCPHLFWRFPLFTEPGEKSKKVVTFFEHVHRGNTISPPLKELSLAQNMRTHWTNWEDKPLVGSHLKCHLFCTVLSFLSPHLQIVYTQQTMKWSLGWPLRKHVPTQPKERTFAQTQVIISLHLPLVTSNKYHLNYLYC